MYGAVTLYGAASQLLPLAKRFVTPGPRCGAIADDPTTPSRQRPQAITPRWFGLIPFRSPLLRESRFLSLPRATKMFQFARLPPTHLWIQYGVLAHYHEWVSPFGHPGINVCSATPPGLSQPTTSFFGSWCQGIHRVPLVSYQVENTKFRYAVFKVRAGRGPLEVPDAGRRRSLKTEQHGHRGRRPRCTIERRHESRRAPSAADRGRRTSRKVTDPDETSSSAGSTSGGGRLRRPRSPLP